MKREGKYYIDYPTIMNDLGLKSVQEVDDFIEIHLNDCEEELRRKNVLDENVACGIVVEIFKNLGIKDENDCVEIFSYNWRGHYYPSYLCDVYYEDEEEY